jgi:hypothetical protein
LTLSTLVFFIRLEENQKDLKVCAKRLDPSALAFSFSSLHFFHHNIFVFLLFSQGVKCLSFPKVELPTIRYFFFLLFSKVSLSQAFLFVKKTDNP